MRISDLPTPSFLVDLPVLERNAQFMLRKAAEEGVRLRPHVKTHKTLEIAEIQCAGKGGPITVSTLAEALFFAEAGWQDIAYAFPLIHSQLEQLVDLNKKIERLHLLADNLESVLAAEEAAKGSKQLSLWLKVDCGYHRSGVDPQSDEAFQIARRIHESSHLDLKGILTHGGQSYQARGPQEIRQAAHQEACLMGEFYRELKAQGIACPEVSVGATPTAVHGSDWEEITEIRPGNYIFFDKFQADIGTCSLADCAVSVLAEVVGHYPRHNHLIVNAGALALSKDPGSVHVLGKTLYGAVAGHPALDVLSISQEHGLISSSQPLEFKEYPIGSRLRIIPNHSCLTAALFPRYDVVEGEMVLDHWTPVRGW